MHFKRELGRGLPKGTPAYVFVHGMNTIFKAKKALSMTLRNILDPRKAFYASLSELRKFKDSESHGNDSLRRLFPEMVKKLHNLSIPEAHLYIHRELTKHGYADIYVRTFTKANYPLHELKKGTGREITALLPCNNNGAGFIITARDKQNQSVLIL